MYCRNCGDFVTKENTFCPKCGQHLTQDSTLSSQIGTDIQKNNKRLKPRSLEVIFIYLFLAIIIPIAAYYSITAIISIIKIMSLFY